MTLTLIPDNYTFKEWSSQMRKLNPGMILPYPTDENSWKKYANQYAQQNPQDVTDLNSELETDWKKWATRTFQG